MRAHEELISHHEELPLARSLQTRALDAVALPISSCRVTKRVSKSRPTSPRSDVGPQGPTLDAPLIDQCRSMVREGDG